MSSEPETPEEVNERFQSALERLRRNFDAGLPLGQLSLERGDVRAEFEEGR